MKKELKKTKGITLIALVITIIILIILATVTIRLVVGKDGIIAMAENAKEKYKQETEKEIIQQLVVDTNINMMTGKNFTVVGEALYNKDIEHNSNWHIMKYNDITYGTDWYYIAKKTKIEGYGDTQSSYLVNYKEGEILQVEDDKILSLSFNESLAVNENIILNIDSSIFDKNIENQKESIENYLGDNVELSGFNYNESSGIINNAFRFDGIDDEIKIPYNETDRFHNGLTFEFYGKILGKAKLVDFEGKDYTDPAGNTMNSFFELSSKQDRESNSKIGFSMDVVEGEVKQFGWKLGVLHNIQEGFHGDFKNNQKDVWDRFLFQDYNLNNWKWNENKYITITIDGTTETEKVFIDGELKAQASFKPEDNVWATFINSLTQCNTFFAGSCSNGNYVGYLKADAYVFRIYGKALSDKEVTDNYLKSIEYHSMLNREE